MNYLFPNWINPIDMTEEQVREQFISTDGEHLITLDWDTDIAPLFYTGTVRFNTFSGDSIEDLIQSVRSIQGLNEASEIVLELSVHEQYCCKTWQMALLVDELCSIPSHPSIVWGYTKTSLRNKNVKLNIIHKLKMSSDPLCQEK